MTAKLALCAGLLLGCSWSALGVAGPLHWQWRDAQGKVVFSDRPPPATVAEKDILMRPGGPAPARAAASSGSRAEPAGVATPAEAGASQALKPGAAADDPVLAAKKKELDAAAEAKRKAEEARQAQARAENCTRAKGYERTLAEGVRVMRTNDKGEREVLDDAGREAEKARARTIIAQDCKP